MLSCSIWHPVPDPATPAVTVAGPLGTIAAASAYFGVAPVPAAPFMLPAVCSAMTGRQVDPLMQPSLSPPHLPCSQGWHVRPYGSISSNRRCPCPLRDSPVDGRGQKVDRAGHSWARFSPCCPLARSMILSYFSLKAPFLPFLNLDYISVTFSWGTVKFRRVMEECLQAKKLENHWYRD